MGNQLVVSSAVDPDDFGSDLDLTCHIGSSAVFRSVFGYIH
jgi:hypothetical protein